MEKSTFDLQLKVSVGDKFIIRYRASCNIPRFDINLINNDINNVILHVNPRYDNDFIDNKKLVLNNRIDGHWQKEVRYDLSEDLRGDKEMTIVVHADAFEITMDDGKKYRFPIRTAVETSTGMLMTGGSFRSVVHEHRYDFE